MCLAIPMKLLRIEEDKGIVEAGGMEREIGMALLKAEPGDYVIVHAGFALQKLDEKEALETIELFREMENL